MNVLVQFSLDNLIVLAPFSMRSSMSANCLSVRLNSHGLSEPPQKIKTVFYLPFLYPFFALFVVFRNSLCSLLRLPIVVIRSHFCGSLCVSFCVLLPEHIVFCAIYMTARVSLLATVARVIYQVLFPSFFPFLIIHSITWRFATQHQYRILPSDILCSIVKSQAASSIR